MKTDPGGRPDVTVRDSPSASGTPASRRSTARRLAAALTIVGLTVVIAFVARHALIGALLARGLSVVSGDRVRIGGFHIGLTRSVFTDVHVTTGSGDPLLDVERVTLSVALRDIFGDRTHRFGLSNATLDRPVLSVVRHRDGSYNIASGRGGGNAPSAGGAGAAWNFGLRIHDGELRLVDRAPVARDLNVQRFSTLDLEANVRSAGRTSASGSVAFIARRTAAGAPARWPIALGADVDSPRGVAIIRLDAAHLPVRGLIGFLQHSAALRVDDGLLRDVGIKIFSLNVGTNRPLDLHIGGSAEVSGGRLTVTALRRAVRNVRGRLILTDDGVWSRRLDGSLAGIPVVARGGAFDRLAPTLRIGVAGDGDLRDLRHAFAFSNTQPVRGGVHVETLLEAPVSGLLIRSMLHIRRGSYAAIPLSDVAGRIDYHAGAVVLDGVRGVYGATTVGLGARFVLGGPALDSAIVAVASAPGRRIPYAENLAPEARVRATALITGGIRGFRARGSIGVAARKVGGEGVFAVDERGVGEFGPFVLARADGSSLIGALRLERPTSRSAAWLSARGYRVAVPSEASRLAGITIPAFPPVAGVIDADVAGGGPSNAFAVAGLLHGRDLRVGNARLGSGNVRLGGTLADVRLGAMRIDGPLGTFVGTAGAARGSFALRGAYNGSLERLVPLTGKQEAHGAVRGDVRATLDGSNVAVQSIGASLLHASIRGVSLDAAVGTIAVRGTHFHLVAATGSIGGRRAVAQESGGTVSISAPDLPSTALRGTGVPLQAGNVSAYGVADLRGSAPGFDGTVTVESGRAQGVRVGGDAQINLVGARARIGSATGALGSTFGSIGGSIDGIGRGALRYDLHARVPLGDIDSLRRDLAIPVKHLAGTFGARLRVRGVGSRPFVDGRIDAGEGTFNGLAFRDAGARLILDRDGIAAQDGSLTVGTTRASVSGSVARGAFGFSARSTATDLADFNDFFDASDTLGGRGSFALALATRGGRVTSSGRIAMDGVRYRGLTLGRTDAAWTMRGAAIAGTALVRSPAGTLRLATTIVPATGSDLMRAFRAADYATTAGFENIDLGGWIPASGSSLPVLGRVDARLTANGRFPRLALRADGTLRDAKIAGVAVGRAHLRARSLGSRVEVLASDADLGYATLSAHGRLGLAPADPLEFDLQVASGDVGRAAKVFVPATRGLDLAGVLDADVHVGGTRARPSISGGFDLRAARYGGFTVPRAIGELALAGRNLELRDADVEFAHGQAYVAGSLPILLHPFSIGPAHAPLSFDMTARGVDLAQFAPLLPAGTKLGGLVDGRFGVEGSVDRPRLFGSLGISNGSYASPFERAPIERVGANVTFDGVSVALKAFHADVGGGTLDGDALVRLPFGRRAQPEYHAGFTAKAAKLDFPAYGRGTLDGRVELDGGRTAPVVTGDLAVRDAVIPVSAVYGSGSSPGAAAAHGWTIDPAFELHVVAGNNVRIRSSIVDIGVDGAVDLGGTLRAPQLAGGFTATDGTISSYNHVFRIVNASVSFNPADGVTPTVSARAVSRVSNPDPDPSRNIAGSANIIVTVSGTADSNNLQVTYSSDPAYSQEQIIGLLLDVPALLGAVNFNLNGGPGAPLLRGAPGETNALLPPGVTPEQVTAISFNQEVFSLLNGQLTQRALSPVERVVEKTLGLSDAELTVDYGGGIGYSLRRQIGKRDFYAFLSQTVSYPERANIGFELVPRPYDAINFSFYQQNGITSLITNATPGEFYLNSTRRYTSVQPLGNRSGLSLNFDRRF